MKNRFAFLEKDFYFAEIIMIFTILSLIGIAALPKLFNLNTIAADDKRKMDVNQIKYAISAERASRLATDPTAHFIKQLDSTASNSSCQNCFHAILAEGLSGHHKKGWSKGEKDNIYIYSGGHPKICQFVYHAANGSFSSETKECNP